ncbi:hypothetical protein [Sphingomonas sp. LHG3406-1]|uniref:hypothetical protein n=1 Tax=Sphingomonas sp. LHG3406-1 TaxID=2804617 RepID=UPI0026113B11|nr:hypothetical protein [Sphingomonas sp. LHG3406-1]
MPIESLKDSQISHVIRRYRERGLSEGGTFTLAELLMEQRRRLKSDLPTVGLAAKIVELARSSNDGLVTYKELWEAFRPGEQWVGNKSQQIMGNALARVVEYCVRHNLPVLTVLVVQSGSRKLDPKAVANIYNDARELGVDTGPDMEAFIARERVRAREVSSEKLPSEPDVES